MAADEVNGCQTRAAARARPLQRRPRTRRPPSPQPPPSRNWPAPSASAARPDREPRGQPRC